jgi:hypothetical protein
MLPLPGTYAKVLRQRAMKKLFLSLVLSFTIISLSFFATKPTYALSSPNPSCLFFGIFGCAVSSAFDYGFNKAMPEIVTDVLSNIERYLLVSMVGTQVLTAENSSQEYLPERDGALGALGLGMKQMYDRPPITVGDYLATIHPIAPTYATTDVPTTQNDIFGDTIRAFWTASRNLAYIFFVIVIVAIGFMLMFRSKIDPRTTVTVTAAIPTLVISLVLITFSLALAALLINIGQVLQEVVKYMLTNPILTQAPLLKNPGGGIGGDQVGLNITDIWVRFLNPAANYVNFGGPFGGFDLVSLLLDLILAVFTFILAIIVFFMLFIRYLNLLVKPLYAPFAFLFGAIPGRSHLITGWFRSYLVDVLTFPLVLLLLNLAMALRSSQGIGGSGDPFGLLSQGVNISGLLVVGILLMATKVPGFLEHALNAKPEPHLARSGTDPQDLLKRVPIVGGMFR